MFMLQDAKKYKQFFTDRPEGNPSLIRSNSSSLGRFGVVPRSRPLESLLGPEWDPMMLDFLKKCLVVDPEDRLTPQAALHHGWLVD